MSFPASSKFYVSSVGNSTVKARPLTVVRNELLRGPGTYLLTKTLVKKANALRKKDPSLCSGEPDKSVIKYIKRSKGRPIQHKQNLPNFFTARCLVSASLSRVLGMIHTPLSACCPRVRLTTPQAWLKDENQVGRLSAASFQDFEIRVTVPTTDRSLLVTKHRS